VKKRPDPVFLGSGHPIVPFKVFLGIIELGGGIIEALAMNLRLYITPLWHMLGRFQIPLKTLDSPYVFGFSENFTPYARIFRFLLILQMAT